MGTNVIVLSFDVMPLSLLGCYGNEWALTPHFDLLAWEGVTFDQHFAGDVAPERRELGWWTGRTEAPPSFIVPEATAKFLKRLRKRGIECCYVNHAKLEPAANATKPVRKSKKRQPTRLERSLKQGLTALEFLPQRSESWLLWLQSDGLTEPIDPPPEYLELYLDELEDLPEDQRSLDLIHAAAAVSHLDHLFGRFREQYEEAYGGEELIWIVTAAGSRPVGFEPDDRSAAGRMSEGFIHTPLIVGSSRGSAENKSKTPSLISTKNAGTRRQQLVQTIDLLPTLCDLFDVEWDEPFEGRSLLPLLNDAALTSRNQIIIHESQRRAGVRTETEFLVCRAPKKADRRHAFGEDHFGKEVLLYRKPEDRWEQHDVSRMEPDLTARLLQQIFPVPR
ncbi:MAG: sulfatase-like hydrolase/transferase [Planctomycetaceae bacterium]